MYLGLGLHFLNSACADKNSCDLFTNKGSKFIGEHFYATSTLNAVAPCWCLFRCLCIFFLLGAWQFVPCVQLSHSISDGTDWRVYIWCSTLLWISGSQIHWIVVGCQRQFPLVHRTECCLEYLLSWDSFAPRLLRILRNSLQLLSSLSYFSGRYPVQLSTMIMVGWYGEVLVSGVGYVGIFCMFLNSLPSFLYLCLCFPSTQTP